MYIHNNIVFNTNLGEHEMLCLFATVLNLLENDQHLHHVHCGGDQMMGPGLGVQHNPPVHIETAPLEQRVNE